MSFWPVGVLSGAACFFVNFHFIGHFMTDLSTSLAASPSLYVVATPLGNLRDISLRALDVLRAVDVIAAEDTRHSQRLLDAYGIRARLLALHEHNEQEAAGGLIRLLEKGQHVALISDAGTPAVSDPGARAVARVREAGFSVIPLPGACAAIAALSVAGFVDSGFYFVGFLPPKTAARRAVLGDLVKQQAPLVFYESPHRIGDCLADLAEVLGPRREIVIARELTKLHEEVVRLSLGEASAWLDGDANRSRGEFVLIIGPAPESAGIDSESERILRLSMAALPLKSAVQLAARISGCSKNTLYARALALKNAGECDGGAVCDEA